MHDGINSDIRNIALPAINTKTLHAKAVDGNWKPHSERFQTTITIKLSYD